MAVMGVLLVVGVVVTLRWGGVAYRPWDPGAGDIRTVALRYLRGVSVALVGGFWAGALGDRSGGAADHAAARGDRR